jgi:hypothetical protein
MAQLAEAGHATLRFLHSLPLVGNWLKATSGVGADAQPLTTGEQVAALGGFAAEAAAGPAIDVAVGRQTLARLMQGEFRAMAGKGTATTFREAANLGGNAADWAYVTSKEVVVINGYRYQAHWAWNTVTGETALAKLKLLDLIPGF